MANILIIDDDPIYSDMMQQRLARAGHRATVHLGPFGGTAAAARPEIDLVILDVFMPGLDGPELLRLMRRSETVWYPPVILCSSMDEEPLSELATRYDADGYIPKSAERVDFLAYVSNVLSRARKRPGSAR